MANTTPWRFWVDTGGTFTDCLAQEPGGKLCRLKVLSTGAVRGEVVAVLSPDRFEIRGLPGAGDEVYAGYSVRRLRDRAEARVQNAERDGERQVFTIVPGGARFEPGDVVDVTADEEAPVLAMRLLMGVQSGASMPPAELRLATTRGTNALLEGRGARVAFFVTEGFGDLLRIGDQRRPDLFAVRVQKPPPLHGPVVEVLERLAADGSVVRALDLASLRDEATAVLRTGVTVAAVALLHSYRNPAHERAVAALLREVGFAHVSESAELAPFIKFLPRAETAVVDAVLAPVMEQYLAGVARAVDAASFFVMTSAGGLVRRQSYRPKDSLLSGPAGGVAGAAAVARRAGFAKVLTFDMGGTSTDVARWAGDFDYRFQHTVGPARVFAPALRVESVAAGGGSICRFDGSAFVVGPESAGAFPGPACYGAGGPLTLTDVNLLLGRLDASTFAVPVITAAAEARLAALLEEVRNIRSEVPERQTVLEGFLAIADERMADAIRRISVREGYDPAEHVLVAFGGAGGLHACAVAERLGVHRVLFPANSGLLSATGLREAVPERFAERQILKSLREAAPELEAVLHVLQDDARRKLAEDGIDSSTGQARREELEMRFVGQEAGLVVSARPVAKAGARFEEAHRNRYGYLPEGRAIEVVRARVVVSCEVPEGVPETFPAPDSAGDGRPRWSRGDLKAGTTIRGTAVISDGFSTLRVAPGWRAVVGSDASVLLDHVEQRSTRSSRANELIELELFTCRFTALVEEMGDMLQRCALSLNVKERLDYSCGLLDAQGELVANAPHIPVHLGALGLCVRTLQQTIPMEPGDVVVTNHPGFGGSHLPDVTLVAPVHDRAGKRIGYVANRAHHAEIGGVRPGSMPPGVSRLADEGVVIAPVYLVRAGAADWAGIRSILGSGPFPSRAVDENLADLHAQLASIRGGVQALRTLADQHGTAAIEEYMEALRTRAAEALTEALAALPPGNLTATDAMDDGSRIVVSCSPRVGASGLRVDFTGSGAVHQANLNATPAIVRSALLYVLRLLAGRDLPLNEGLMRDVDLVVPPGLLAPDFSGPIEACPAVAGGNVETSQRIVDVLLSALRIVACSQGTMNNVSFGTDCGSYYETIAGGTGAGPDFSGCDAVHSHMTNTSMTDAEVLELRLPVRVKRFAVRSHSGGTGAYRGGNGVDRRLEFLAPAALSLVTQRRRIGPRPMNGGLAGSPGSQWIVRCRGAIELLEGVALAEMNPGDELVLHTPGGGGCGQEGTSGA